MVRVKITPIGDPSLVKTVCEADHLDIIYENLQTGVLKGWISPDYLPVLQSKGDLMRVETL